jgi:hypothetical protein
MCLTETHSSVRVDKNLSGMFPIKNVLNEGDALSPLLFNFVLVYSIRRVHVNQGGLKLNSTHQLLVIKIKKCLFVFLPLQPIVVVFFTAR